MSNKSRQASENDPTFAHDSVGREPAAAYGETSAGQWQKVSREDVYQFCGLPISPCVEPGKPESGLLPEISSEAPGDPGQDDFKVQAYNFRMYLRDNITWTLNDTTRPMTDGPVQMRNRESPDAFHAGAFWFLRVGLRSSRLPADLHARAVG